MAQYAKFSFKETIVGRLEHDMDILEELTDICGEEKIQSARLEAIGAVKKAVIGYYQQSNREYQFKELKQSMEIVSLIGNVSLKEGEPMVHAHINLADDSGNCFGGHLAEGTIVFACEFMLHCLDGPALQRRFDKQTGLTLWGMAPLT